jgi:hypothetical protein
LGAGEQRSNSANQSFDDFHKNAGFYHPQSLRQSLFLNSPAQKKKTLEIQYELSFYLQQLLALKKQLTQQGVAKSLLPLQNEIRRIVNFIAKQTENVVSPNAKAKKAAQKQNETHDIKQPFAEPFYFYCDVSDEKEAEKEKAEPATVESAPPHYTSADDAIAAWKQHYADYLPTEENPIPLTYQTTPTQPTGKYRNEAPASDPTFMRDVALGLLGVLTCFCLGAFLPNVVALPNPLGLILIGCALIPLFFIGIRTVLSPRQEGEKSMDGNVLSVCVSTPDSRILKRKLLYGKKPPSNHSQLSSDAREQKDENIFC